MRVNAGILIIICLLFLVGTVGAAGVPATVRVTTDKLWVIANGADQSTVTVTVTDSNGSGVPEVTVSLAGDPLYGTLDPATITTDASGKATSTFRTGTKSGAPQITATTGDPAISGWTVQNIEHDLLVPTFIPAAGTVGDVVSFNVSITDQWGNPIDDRRSDTTVTLSVSCPMPNDCEFVGSGHFYTARPDVNGNLTVPLQLGTKTGAATIVMSPVQDLSQQVFMIDTRAGYPVMTVEVYPVVVSPYTIPTVPVNTGEFEFAYTLSDTYGNPVADQPVLIRTSLNEEQVTMTDALGRTPLLTYGPKGTICTVDITATVVDTAVTNQFTVAFTTAAPKDMTLVATPHTVGSLEYDPLSQAEVVVRVLDNFGNPVSGESITFDLDYTEDPATWNITPVLTRYSGITDADGRVKAVFIPGGFNQTKPTEASCQLTAVWTSNPSYTPKTVTLTWLNQPYLNIFTSVSPDTVVVGDTVNVTIRLVANGKPGTYRPVTLMLDQDTSANMKNPSDGGISRIDAAANASEFIIYSMNPYTTRMGLETFGYDQPTGHMPVPADYAELIYNYKTLTCLQGAKGMEASMYRSYNQIITNTQEVPHTRDVKVLIMFSDGGSNLDSGDSIIPLKSIAMENNIHIFVIAYVGSADSGSAAEMFRDLTSSTGGKYYEARTSADVVNFYLDIETLIKKLSEEDTTMTVSFQNIVINNIAYAYGGEVYDYIPVNIPADLPAGVVSPASSSGDPDARTTIIWANESRSVVDQSEQFPNLAFFVGSLDIGQEWSTTFSLRVKRPGTYNMFGPESMIVLSGNPLYLPELPITVQEHPDDTGFKSGTVDVYDLSNSADTDFVRISWKTNYVSPTSMPASPNKAAETVSYRVEGSSGWKTFYTTEAGVGVSTQTATLDARNIPRDKQIYVKVRATAVDAHADEQIISFSLSGTQGTYINLT
jgi:hypothetical protein